MATVTVKQGFSFLAAQDWDWNVTSASGTSITISDGVHTQIFTGSFSLGAGDSVSGTASSSEYKVNGASVYKVTGMADSAAKLATYANTSGDTQAAYAYVLRGSDKVFGSAAADILLGYAGNDTLNGNAGNDVLIGGIGRDTLSGGSGKDSFDFNAFNELGLGVNRDVITDFARGQDKIDLSTIDAKPTVAGNQAFVFKGSAAFTAAGQIRYAGGIVSINTDTDSAAEYEIQLTGITSLAATDFVL